MYFYNTLLYSLHFMDLHKASNVTDKVGN